MFSLLCVLVSLWFPPFDTEPSIPLISHFIYTVVLAPSGNYSKTDPLKLFFWPTEYIDLCFCIHGARFCLWVCLKITPLYHKIQPKVTFLTLICLSKTPKSKYTSILTSVQNKLTNRILNYNFLKITGFIRKNNLRSFIWLFVLYSHYMLGRCGRQVPWLASTTTFRPPLNTGSMALRSTTFRQRHGLGKGGERGPERGGERTGGAGATGNRDGRVGRRRGGQRSGKGKRRPLVGGVRTY